MASPFKSPRITVIETPELLEIMISGKIPSGQFTALSVWLAAWTVLGIYVIAQFFTGMSSDQKLYMYVWLAFWIYFEYKGVIAWTWRRSGTEIFRMRKDKTDLSFQTTIRPLSSTFETPEIVEFKNLDEAKGNLTKAHFESFWVVGGETLGLIYRGKQYAFGRQLPPEDVRLLMQMLEKRLKKSVKTARS